MRHLLAVLLFVTPAFAQQPQPDVITKAMHGQVHTVRVEGKRDSNEFTREAEETFNLEGWLTEMKRYGLNNQLMEHHLFKRQGARMIEHDMTRYLPAESAERIITTFEEHGFPLQQTTYSLDGSVRERMQVIYEEAQIRELHYDANDKLVTTRTISTVHDPNSPDRHIEQRVNGKPETITDIHRDGESITVRQKEFKDGAAAQIARDIRPTGTTTAVVNSDGSSFAASSRFYDSDELVGPDGSRTKAKFDDLGQRIEEDRYDAAGKLTEATKYAYETDDRGNWTRRASVSSTEPNRLTIVIRTFTYY